MGAAEEADLRADALEDLSRFPLMEALFGRRSRRFALGDEIPDGPLAYRSTSEPVPLTELERTLVLCAMGGTTGWHYGITRHARYAPHVANYSGAAAGPHLPVRGRLSHRRTLLHRRFGHLLLSDPGRRRARRPRHRGGHAGADGRAPPRPRSTGSPPSGSTCPPEEPYMEGHNTWCANVPGSLLVIPVADIAQHLLAILCFFAQNGYAIYDDVNGRRSPGSRSSATWSTSRTVPAHLHRAVRADRGHRGARRPAATRAC